MKTIVIGGGASGLIAAINAAKNDEVILIEKNNKLGKKLLITGSGKCNYFNNDFTTDNYYTKEKELLKEIINLKNKQRVLEFISSLGIIPTIKNGYYYPRTNQASTLLEAIETELKLRKVKINLEEEVQRIKQKNDLTFEIITNKNKYTCNKIILATGGLAYPKTGSTGEGYRFLKEFNHTVNEIKPALTGLITKEKYRWDKVRSDGKVSLYIDGKLSGEEEGNIQFTEYGLSGICVFNLSPLVSLNKGKNIKVKINFLNEFNFTKQTFINWLDERCKTLKDRNISNILKGFLNHKLVLEILKKSNIKDKLYSELSKKEKEILASNILEFETTIIDTNTFSNSQTSVGGIPLTEVNIKTMESKKIKNLYITGELLDVTGKCGGYNIGFAFLTGLLASDKNE